MSRACTDLAVKWATSKNYNEFKAEDLATFNPLQKRQFLSELSYTNITLDAVKRMDKLYNLTSFKNSEIRFRWLRLCIKVRWIEKLQQALQFANEQGRMKYVRPIYRDLYAWPDVRNQTIENFEANRRSFMHVLEYTLKKDLKLN